MKDYKMSKDPGMLNEPAVAYGGSRLNNLKRELSVAIDSSDDEELLAKCLSMIKQTRERDPEMSSIEQSLNDLREGRVVEVQSVKELMDSLNS